jgi:hypothetical protein
MILAVFSPARVEPILGYVDVCLRLPEPGIGGSTVVDKVVAARDDADAALLVRERPKP